MLVLLPEGGGDVLCGDVPGDPSHMYWKLSLVRGFSASFFLMLRN
jgi:hypothetical protein